MSSLFSHSGADEEGPSEEAPAAEELGNLSLGEDAPPKLFIGNLSWSVTSDELEAYLSQAGHVTYCEVKRNYNGQSKGFALASYADVPATEKAIAMLHDVEMQGRRLIVRVDSRPEDRPFFGGGRGSRGGRYDETRGRSGRFGSRGPPPRDDPPPSERVFCGNLPFATTQADLDSIFAGSGASFSHLVTDDSGQSRGYAIITFPSIDAASDAIHKFNGFRVGERPMRCKFDSRPPK